MKKKLDIFSLSTFHDELTTFSPAVNDSTLVFLTSPDQTITPLYNMKDYLRRIDMFFVKLSADFFSNIVVWLKVFREISSNKSWIRDKEKTFIVAY